MRRLTSSIALTVALATVWMPATAAIPGCADATTGGDWRFFGADRSNTRAQPDEDVIGPDNVGALAPGWTFSTTKAGGGGIIDAVPIVADGCLFVASSDGSVFALNADTGQLVWRVKLDGGVQSSLAVVNGRVFVNQMAVVEPYRGPATAALDAATGDVLWETVLTSFVGTGIFASPMVFDGMVMVGLSSNGAESGPQSGQFRGSVVFLDETTGAEIRRTYTIPPSVWDQGYAGAGVWSTAAVDEARRYAYVGTGNPFYNRYEYGTTNAIIKIDIDRSRPTFGEIVGTYKGEPDQYIGSERTVCEATKDHPGPTVGGRDMIRLAACELFDIDFGASPNLFESNGRLIVGALQKSGTYHAADAGTMAPYWRRVLGSPAFGLVTGAASTAVADGRVYGSYAPPSFEYALDGDTGDVSWLTPLAGQSDTGRFEPTAVANGVVYQLDGAGILSALDAETGALLLQRRLAPDVGATTVTTAAGGVSIARHRVYAAADQYIVSYALAE